MSNLTPEFEEIRLAIDQMRSMLENLSVRGLRACGTDEITQLKSHAEYLDRAGAGHVAATLAQLQSEIEKDDRAAAGTLLQAQIAIRMLERVLTLKVVRTQYQAAAQMQKMSADQSVDDEDDES